MLFTSAARTDVGCKRRVNEDALLRQDGLPVWAVADGMGGHHSGDVASALVIDTLLAAGLEGGPDRAPAAKLALQAANAKLVALAREGHGDRTIGATVVLLLADAANYCCLWAGDSRAYRARGGVLRQLTRDHSLVQELIDAGEVDPAEANSHPNANIIRRAVGAAPELDLDLVEGGIAPGDTFLLASDGLTRLIDDQELLIEMTAPDLEVAADRLLAAVLARGAPDNVSLVLIRPL